jgi:hypothetical protein
MEAKVISAQERWSTVVCAQRASGLTIRNYCEQHKINTKTFYGWLKRIPLKKNTSCGFIQLTLPVTPQVVEVRITTPNGYHVDVKETCNLRTIFEMLRAI